MNVGFERIDPTPTYPPGTSLTQLSAYSWDSSAAVVANFKRAIKARLRDAQRGRCCYCRRLLSDDIATHIEHFVEKAQYAAFTFEIRNLALSCGTCNTQKNGTGRTLTSILKRRAERAGVQHSPRCSTLAVELAPGSALPDKPASYRWVHPHLDEYSANIQIMKGWIFAGKTPKGRRTVRGTNLNALSEIERRALFERLATRGGRLSLLVASIAELDRHRATEVADAVSKVLRRRRK